VTATLTPPIGSQFAMNGPRLSAGPYILNAQIQITNGGDPTTIRCTLGGPFWTQSVPSGSSATTLSLPIQLDVTTTVAASCAFPAAASAITIPQYEIDALAVGTIN
jgi:hypothetical protein